MYKTLCTPEDQRLTTLHAGRRQGRLYGKERGASARGHAHSCLATHNAGSRTEGLPGVGRERGGGKKRASRWYRMRLCSRNSCALRHSAAKEGAELSAPRTERVGRLCWLSRACLLCKGGVVLRVRTAETLLIAVQRCMGVALLLEAGGGWLHGHHAVGRHHLYVPNTASCCPPALGPREDSVLPLIHVPS